MKTGIRFYYVCFELSFNYDFQTKHSFIQTDRFKQKCKTWGEKLLTAEHFGPLALIKRHGKFL